ncbi:replication initiator [Microtetraspora malaysiensis]|uniref:replication initiator n=1 Tax=Microtetraspora malaysiensis TaxID=161358 RepID=UPI003D8DDC2A
MCGSAAAGADPKDAEGAAKRLGPVAERRAAARRGPARGLQVYSAAKPELFGVIISDYGEDTYGDSIECRRARCHSQQRFFAGYIAKYATKGAEASGTVDHRLSCPACGGRGRLSLLASCGHCHGTGLKPGLHLDALPVTEHACRMTRTCWELGARPKFAALRLRPWAHMRHFSSKSRAYSVNLGDLRGARALHRAVEARERHGLPALGDTTTLVLGHWRFAGTGYTQGEAIMAEHIRQRVATARKIATEREDG